MCLIGVFTGFLLGFYWVLPGFTGLTWVSLGFTGFYWVILGFTGFYRALLGFIGFYRVLLGFSLYFSILGIYWVDSKPFLLACCRFFFIGSESVFIGLILDSIAFYCFFSCDVWDFH